MSKNSLFPIRGNVTVIPPEFRCSGLELSSENFYGLKKIGCVNVILAYSPQGWKVLRGGMTEPDHIDFFFIVSGNFSIETPEITCHAGKGQLLIIPSWIDRKVCQTEEGSYVYIRIDIPREKAKIHSVSVRDYQNIGAVELFTRSLLVNNSTLPEESAYRASLAECLAILCSRELHPIHTRAAYERTEALLRQLQCANAEHWSVHAMARQFSMSLSSFRKFCMEHFEKSPRELIEDVRMSRARVLLNYNELTIDDIAAQLGYADRFVFSKAFGRSNGVTPGVFRKKTNLPS